MGCQGEVRMVERVLPTGESLHRDGLGYSRALSTSSKTGADEFAVSNSSETAG